MLADNSVIEEGRLITKQHVLDFGTLFLFDSSSTSNKTIKVVWVQRLVLSLVRQVSYLSYPNQTKREGSVRVLLDLPHIVLFVSRYVFMLFFTTSELATRHESYPTPKDLCYFNIFHGQLDFSHPINNLWVWLHWLCLLCWFYCACCRGRNSLLSFTSRCTDVKYYLNEIYIFLWRCSWFQMSTQIRFMRAWQMIWPRSEPGRRMEWNLKRSATASLFLHLVWPLTSFEGACGRWLAQEIMRESPPSSVLQSHGCSSLKSSTMILPISRHTSYERHWSRVSMSRITNYNEENLLRVTGDHNKEISRLCDPERFVLFWRWHLSLMYNLYTPKQKIAVSLKKHFADEDLHGLEHQEEPWWRRCACGEPPTRLLTFTRFRDRSNPWAHLIVHLCECYLYPISTSTQKTLRVRVTNTYGVSEILLVR